MYELFAYIIVVASELCSFVSKYTHLVSFLCYVGWEIESVFEFGCIR